MEFLFHSVYYDGHHAKYFNVYKIADNRFLAEPHHFNFNSLQIGMADFELRKEGGRWKTEGEKLGPIASYIGEEIDRLAYNVKKKERTF
ncbi:MAG TPA: hypothetical protein PK339_08505 [Flavitalea sp.]|nr:hypothetical protein [Flavitalea sp.]